MLAIIYSNAEADKRLASQFAMTETIGRYKISRLQPRQLP
jgi:hypothetical protein